jgi:hypothetical protein
LWAKHGFRSSHNLFNISESNVNLAVDDGRTVVASTVSMAAVTKTAVGALTGMVVETLVSIVAVVTVDGGGAGGWNRVSGGSGGESGVGSGRQQQKLGGQATINKMQQAALVAAETATMAAAIVAVRLGWQAGVAARRKWQRLGQQKQQQQWWLIIPFFPWPWWETMRDKISRSVDQRWWYGTFLCLWFTTLILWVPVNRVKGPIKTQFMWCTNTFKWRI